MPTLLERLDTIAQLSVSAKPVQKTIYTPDDYMRQFSPDSAIMVKRKSFRAIPDDYEILSKISTDLEEYGVIKSSTCEVVMDKMIYYYHHFIWNSDSKIKTYFYNGYIKLMTELVKKGFKLDDFTLVKDIAMLTKRSIDKAFSEIQQKLSGHRHNYMHREISRLYERIRMDNTAFGENVEYVLSYLTSKSAINFI